MRIFIGCLICLMACSPPAQAQMGPAKGKDDETICVGGPSWQPTFADSRAIETVPVPDSYRSMFESTEPCVRWSMGLDGIVDWHLRFGSATSVSAALGYIDRDSRRSVPAPVAYLPLLRKAFAVALPDLKRAAALKQPPGLAYSVSYKFMQQSKTVVRLNELLDAREDYVFFARQYLRAAEEFVDPALLTTAENFIATANAAADFLAPLEDKPPVQGQLYFNLYRFETDDFSARAALLRARISGSTADLDRADTILRALELPTDKALAGLVFSGGDDFCDITDGASDSEAIEAACRADDDVKDRLSNLVIDRAQYDAIVAAEKGKQLDTRSSWTWLAERLLAREALPDHGRCCGRSVGEDQLRLLMTRADYGVRSVGEMRGATALWEEKDRCSRVWYETLSLLTQAERLAPPYTAPARFARIAGQWLNIWRAGPVAFADRGERVDPMKDPDKQRFAAYIIASLSDLAGKEAAPR